jgi:hypothetical protein
MPPAWLSELAKSAAWRRVPWGRALAAAIWLFRQGRERLENLSQRERQELAEIVRKSRARPSNLSARDRERLRELVRKALTGRRHKA